MDITKLVMMGKIEEDFKVGGCVFKITTPSYAALPMTQQIDPIAVLSNSIVSIDGEAIDTDAKKEDLKKTLAAMQGTVVAKLLSLSSGLVEKQNTLVDGLISKKG